MNPKKTPCWLYGLLALVSGCGTGASDTLRTGIEGSGQRITASGVVTAIGSIFVNGVEYDVDTATITINGSPARPSDLAPGHVTIVEGRLSADGMRGVATRVTAEIAVAGPIAAVDTPLHRLVILGQTVAVDSSTVIDERLDGTAVSGLNVDQDVEVSGFADSAGVLHAKRIERRRTATPLLVTGYATHVDATARTFSVNGQVVSYAAATLLGFGSRALEGARVRIVATRVDQGTLIADAVELKDLRLPGERGGAAVLQGLITRFGSEVDFDVDGRAVVATTTTTTEGVVQLDALVVVSGALSANGIVEATDVRAAVLPSRFVGAVTIDGSEHGLSGVVTGDGTFRLSIGDATSGPPELGSALGQLVGSFTATRQLALGTGVLIGETCAPSSPGRFCGAATEVRIELVKTSSTIDGAAGVIRVGTDDGEQVWPLRTGYWGGRAGFDAGNIGSLVGVYELQQAELIRYGNVTMSVDGQSRLFFQHSQTGCVGNGAISSHGEGAQNLYNVTLKIEGCGAPFGYLNADFLGLSTLESRTPWDYDVSVLRIWVSTPPGAAVPAAISFWGERP